MSNDLDIIAHYLKRTVSPGSFDCYREIEDACKSIAQTIENQEARIKELEKELKQTKAAASHANNIASCLANGIQPD